MQDEVDYTQFYYSRPQAPDREGFVRPPARPTGEEVAEESEKPRRKKRIKKERKGGKFFFGLFVVVLCFALVFFCADFFGKGFLTDAVSKAFAGETYEYHFVVKPASSRFVAYADSLKIRQGGGGGYIMGSDEYFVAYAVYTDKTTAIGVQAKNKDSEIRSVKYRTKESYAKDVNILVLDLEKGIADWERGSIGENDLTTILLAEKEIFSGKASTNESMNGLNKLILDGLDEIELSATEKITQLSKLRYFLCCVVYSAQSVFGK